MEYASTMHGIRLYDAWMRAFTNCDRNTDKGAGFFKVSGLVQLLHNTVETDC